LPKGEETTATRGKSYCNNQREVAATKEKKILQYQINGCFTSSVEYSLHLPRHKNREETIATSQNRVFTSSVACSLDLPRLKNCSHHQNHRSRGGQGGGGGGGEEGRGGAPQIQRKERVGGPSPLTSLEPMDPPWGALMLHGSAKVGGPMLPSRWRRTLQNGGDHHATEFAPPPMDPPRGRWSSH
jgi:hypothetical protein